MNWWNKFWIVLFVVGFAYFCYGCYDGAGLSGLLTRWQIETSGTLSVGLWGPFSFVVLVFLPLCFVVKTSKKQPVQLREASLLPLGVFTGLVAGLGLLSGVAYLQAQQALKEPMVQLRGVGQDALKVSYVSAWATGRGLSSTAGAEIRSFIPVTEPNWKPGEPVRFVFSLRTSSLPKGPLPTGMMQQNALPWYLRSLFEKRGVKLSKPYFVVDKDGYRATHGEWNALSIIAGTFCVVLLGLGIGIFWPFTDLRNRCRFLRRS